MAQPFMLREEELNSWEELVHLVREFQHPEDNWIFRGVTDYETHDLVPAIGRSLARKNFDGTLDDFSAADERAMFDQFIREARPYVLREPNDRLAWLAVAQHHGMPTRLLDWTESLLAASFFAVRPSGIIHGVRVDAAIYGVRAPATASSQLQKNPFREDAYRERAYLYRPPHLSPRITAQRGLFTVHAAPTIPWRPVGDCIKWRISSTLCFEIKLLLDSAGTNAASMFPDLDGLGEHLGWRYKWQRLDPDGYARRGRWARRRPSR